jgi:dienelactone hydrolase
MKAYRLGSALATIVAAFSLAAAQSYAPPPVQMPDEATLKAIANKSRQLEEAIESLRRQGVRDPYLADAQIYHKAANWIGRHQEYYQQQAGAWTLEILEQGLARARQLSQKEAPWFQQVGRTIVRGHRSRVDGSVQPYAVTFPAEYGKDPKKKWRIDVVLHGRDTGLTEVKFLHEHSTERATPKDQTWVQLDIYGRGNNAYRWAGETEVIECVDDFLAVERLLGREALVDPARFVLRGFSMGGAGAWHLGLHNPSRWCVIGPGAGFTATHGYVKNLPEKLPPEQEACLHIYDAVNYAENAFDVPVVAYAGEKDAQLQAARTMEAKLKPLNLPMKLLIAPGLAHSFPPEWRKRAEEAYAPFVVKGREEYPARILFVTYTLRYPSCAWVELLGLDQHYDRALVDAEFADTGYTVKTVNVRTLHLTLAANVPNPLVVTIDGQSLTPRPYLNRAGVNHLYLERRDGRWADYLPQKIFTDRLRRLQKVPGLQGPIDDAFMDSFVCVRGTGTPWHEGTQTFAEETLKRFEGEWDKYLRGYLPVKDDTAVTDEDIAGRNLILFGDPSSNLLIGQILDRLPLKWTKEQIELAGKTYAASEHVPVMIFPSPLAAGRYIVLNSGHTFHAADFAGTNALLYPRLGDYALLKIKPTEKQPLASETLTAGIFDDFWRIAEQGK